jgi:hypothetical protein
VIDSTPGSECLSLRRTLAGEGSLTIYVDLKDEGALAAWVPAEFWQSFFLVDHPLVAKVWGPIVGPLVAVISFACSVGNIPLVPGIRAE